MFQYILIGLAILVVYLIITDNKKIKDDTTTYNELANDLMVENDQLQQKLNILETNYGPESTSIYYQRLRDALAMPYRRIPQLVPDSRSVVPININTQGGPDPVQALGYLSNGTDDQILQLFGRKLYDNNYEYYTQTKDDAPVKIPIDIKNNQELYDGNNVTVTPYNTKTWTVHMYEIDYPRYLPNVI